MPQGTPTAYLASFRIDSPAWDDDHLTIHEVGGVEEGGKLTLVHERHVSRTALAPSEEAFDTPLSPPPLDDEPGRCYPALRYLPGRDFHPQAWNSFQDAPCQPIYGTNCRRLA